MRWIDIDLSEPRISQETTILLQEAERLTAEIPGIQDREGLDARAVVDQMRAVGRLLFQAVLLVDKEAFHPHQDSDGIQTPGNEHSDRDHLIGYHLITDPGRLELPWFWLHNGLEFLAAKNPICAAETASAPESIADQRPWMNRFVRAGFLVGKDGDTSLQSILREMQGGTLGPELLFVPGHTEEAIRRLIYREAEAIGQALEARPVGDPLVRLKVPADAITPSQLPGMGFSYQAIHFAGPTSKPARTADIDGEFWMNQLLEESFAPSDEDLEEAVGVEGEVLGVDPITSLLDDVCQKFDRNGGPRETMNLIGGQVGETQKSPKPEASKKHSWLLPDGPIDPEGISRSGGIPPLVFSNSYRALPELGYRFTSAGASTFIGPLVPLFSRPARIFAGHCYGALGEGWCAGAAVWKASQACRHELGEEHPAWLSYGLQGFGSLALQYL